MGLAQFGVKYLTPLHSENSRDALIFWVEKPTHMDPIESKNNLVKYRYSEMHQEEPRTFPALLRTTVEAIVVL